MERDISNGKHRAPQLPDAKIPVSDTSDTIKVFVQDYHDLYRQAFITLLRINGISVINDVQNGVDVIQAINPANLPDIAIINYKTSKRESLNAACLIKEQYPGVKIIINTQYNYSIPIERIKQIDIEGIIIKAIHSTAQIINVIRLVYSGGRFYAIATPAL